MNDGVGDSGSIMVCLIHDDVDLMQTSLCVLALFASLRCFVCVVSPTAAKPSWFIRADLESNRLK